MSDQPEFIAENVGRQLAEGGGMWAPCSGCHESVDGYSVDPIDPVFKCYRGSGCSECGGIGAIWDTTDYEALASAMVKDMHSAPAQGAQQPVKEELAKRCLGLLEGARESCYRTSSESDANWCRDRYIVIAELRDLIEGAAPAQLPQDGGDAA